MKNKTTTKNKVRDLFRRVLLVLAGLIFGLSIYNWNACVLAGNALPMPFGIGSAVVMSGSMEPTLSVNDLVFIREADSYAVEDIVVYQSGNDLVIHKIIEIDGDVIITQGEANNTPDDPIAQRYIKGKMIMAIPHVGAIVQIVKSLPGTIVLLAIAILLIELSWKKEKTGKDETLDSLKEEIRQLKEELNNTNEGNGNDAT